MRMYLTHRKPSVGEVRRRAARVQLQTEDVVVLETGVFTLGLFPIGICM